MPSPPVLVVDLDGTLIRSDLLHESFWSALARNWTVPFVALRHMLNGRAELKHWLAGRSRIDVTTLPYDPLVLEMIAARRAEGGRIMLVTAADHGLAERVAAHLGLFDEVAGSDGSTNLKGAEKAALLLQAYGPKGFDYLGDARVDLPVWAEAAQSYTLHAPAGLRASVDAVAPGAVHLGAAQGWLRPAWRAMRPHQWLKNLLVFVPVLAAHEMALPPMSAATPAFLAFCLSASAVYVLNDLLDLRADRSHPRKRKRPFASGDLPIQAGVWLFAGLALAGLAIGALVGAEFAALLVLYQVATAVYSLFLKRRAVIDICTLAGLYTLRIVAGGVATGITLSVWLLAFSTFFFFSLAASKRLAELSELDSIGGRLAAGRGYRVEDLPLVAGMALSSGYLAVLVMALYINVPEVQALYTRPEFLWGVCPVLLYWISRVVLWAHRGEMPDDPVVFAMRDRTSLQCLWLILAFLVLADLP
jgi:4-hydroxybenzoate polyprenyltransferase/phosphoserine phosphatase